MTSKKRAAASGVAGRQGWSRRTGGRGAVAGLAAGAVLMLATPGLAQEDPAQVDAGLEVWKRGGCSACHATFATGGGDGGTADGPSLRTTMLDRQSLYDTIACGRPGTEMPYHVTGGYTEVECYGITDGVLEGTARGVSLSPEEIESLVAYLMERVVGKGDVTQEECGLYFGAPNHPLCRGYN